MKDFILTGMVIYILTSFIFLKANLSFFFEYQRQRLINDIDRHTVIRVAQST